MNWVQGKGAFYIILTVSMMSLSGVLLLPGLNVRGASPIGGTSISIKLLCPGTRAQKIEKEVTSVIEAVVGLLQEIGSVQSTTIDGQATITADVKKKADLEEVRYRVSGSVREIRKDLPDYVKMPVIEMGGLDLVNTCVYRCFVSGIPDPARAIRRWERKVREMANRDVSVEVSGMTNEELRMTIQPPGRTSLFGTGETGSPDPAAKSLKSVTGQKIKLELAPVEEEIPFMALPVYRQEIGKIWQAGDLVYGRWKQVEPVSPIRLNGKEAVMISVYLRGGGNHYIQGVKVRKGFIEFLASLPEGAVVVTDYDMISTITKNLRLSILTLAILPVFFLLLLLWGPRSFFAAVGTWYLNLAVIMFILLMTRTVLYPGSSWYLIAGIWPAIPWSVMIRTGLGTRTLAAHVSPVIIPSMAASLVVIMIFFMERGHLDAKGLVLVIALVVTPLMYIFLFPALLGMQDTGSHVDRSGTPFSEGRSYLHARSFRLPVILAVITGCLWLAGAPMEISGWMGAGNDTPKWDIMSGIAENARKVLERSKAEGQDEQLLTMLFEFPSGTDTHDADSLLKVFEKFLHRSKAPLHYITHLTDHGTATLDIRIPNHDEPAYQQLTSSLIHLGLSRSGFSWHILGAGKSYHSVGSAQSDVAFSLRLSGYQYALLCSEKERIIRELERNPRIVICDVATARLDNRDPDGHEERFRIDLVHSERAMSMLARHQTRSIELPRLGRIVASAAGDGYASRFELLQALPGVMAAPGHPGTARAIQRENQEYFDLIRVDYKGLRRSGTEFIDAFIATQEKALPAGYHLKKVSWHNSPEEVDLTRRMVLLSLVVLYFILVISTGSFCRSLYIMASIFGAFTVIVISLDQFTYWEAETCFLVLVSGLTIALSLLLSVIQFSVYRHIAPWVKR